MKILIRENENDSWVEQEVIYHDGKVWFQINDEFIEIQIQKGKEINL